MKNFWLVPCLLLFLLVNLFDVDGWKKEDCLEMQSEFDLKEYYRIHELDLDSIEISNEDTIVNKSGIYFKRSSKIDESKVLVSEMIDIDYGAIVDEITGRGGVDKSKLPNDYWDFKVYAFNIITKIWEYNCDSFVPTNDDYISWILFSLYYETSFGGLYSFSNFKNRSSENYEPTKLLFIEKGRSSFYFLTVYNDPMSKEPFNFRLDTKIENSILSYFSNSNSIEEIREFVSELKILNGAKFKDSSQFKLIKLWEDYSIKVKSSEVKDLKNISLEYMNFVEELTDDSVLFNKSKKWIVDELYSLEKDLMEYKDVQEIMEIIMDVDASTVNKDKWIKLKKNKAVKHLEVSLLSEDISDVLYHYNQAMTLDKNATTKKQWNEVLARINREIFSGKLIKIDGGIYNYVDNKSNKKIEIPSYFIGQTEVTVEKWNLCFEMGWCNRKIDENEYYKVYREGIYDADFYKRFYYSGNVFISRELGEINQLPVEMYADELTGQFFPWLAAVTGVKYQIPNEYQWEFAAKSNSEAKYPWGEDIGVLNAHCPKCEIYKDTLYLLPFEYLNFPKEVMSYSKNSYGLFDTFGNVAEVIFDCGENHRYIEALTGLSNEHCVNKPKLKGGGYNIIGLPDIEHDLEFDFNQLKSGIRIVENIDNKYSKSINEIETPYEFDTYLNALLDSNEEVDFFDYWNNIMLNENEFIKKEKLKTNQKNKIQYFNEIVGDFEWVTAGVFSKEVKTDGETIKKVLDGFFPFQLNTNEVTFKQWDACVSAGGCSHIPKDITKVRGNNPVVDVSYNDITEQFIPWLEYSTGEAFRLPTIHEWHHARKGNSMDDLLFSELSAEEQCLECENTIKNQQTNGFGISGMHNAIDEWTGSCELNDINFCQSRVISNQALSINTIEYAKNNYRDKNLGFRLVLQSDFVDMNKPDFEIKTKKQESITSKKAVKKEVEKKIEEEVFKLTEEQKKENNEFYDELLDFLEVK